jgi:hypothetical protein
MIRERHRHACSRPPTWQFLNGSIWMCDHCGKLWIKRFGDRQAFGFQHGHWLRIYNPLRIWWLKRNAVGTGE